MPNIEAERAVALAIIDRGLAKGFAVNVLYEGLQRAFDTFTTDREAIARELVATDLDVVVFAQKPAQDPRWARRGSITFVWGNGPDEVAADYSDNIYMRELVEGLPAAA